MIHKAKEIEGFKVICLDGELGKVKDFFFDDKHWSIRYLIIETGNWLSGRHVLISPYALIEVNCDSKRIRINLTKMQIEASPSLKIDQTVSQQFEVKYYDYYSYPMYWGGLYMWGYTPNIVREDLKWKKAIEEQKMWDSNLRSSQEVSGYYIQALDGEIGYVNDILFDDSSWAIRYLVVDTKHWWVEEKVLVSPNWIKQVSWEDAKVFVNFTCKDIKQSPGYSEKSLINQDYETLLHRHYEQAGFLINESAIQ